MKHLLTIAAISGLCLVPAATASGMSSEKSDSTINLNETVITGTRISVPRDILPSPVTVIGRSELEDNGSIALLPTLTQEVPGLFVTTRGVAGYGTSTGAAGGISLRGLAGSAGRVLILIDGHPQYAAIYGHPVADAYIANDAERVEVIRGASSILYGSNAMGGAINIITRQSPDEGNTVNAGMSAGSYGTRRYSVSDNFRKDRFSAFGGVNVERSDGHRENSEFDSYNGMAKMGYEINDNWSVRANVNLSKFVAHNPGEEATPLTDCFADIVRGMSGLSVVNAYDRTSGAVNLYYNWGNHVINDGYKAGGVPQPFLFKSTDYMGGANIYQSFDTWQGNVVTAGFDAKFYGGNAFRNPATEYYADHKNLRELAGYLFMQQTWRGLMAEAGIRMENHSLYGTEWIPQAGISYMAPWGTSLKFSYAKGFRTPNLRELYMYASANEELKPERSQSFDLQLSQRALDGRLYAELGFFYIKGDNMVEVVRENGKPQNRNVGSFANKGIEALVSYNILDNLRLHTNYSYLYMDTPITGAPRNKLYFGADYKPGRFALHAGMQWIDDLYLVTGENAATDSFVLVDARVAFRPLDGFEVFVKGDNLLGRSYYTMAGMPMPGATFMVGFNCTLKCGTCCKR